MFNFCVIFQILSLVLLWLKSEKPINITIIKFKNTQFKTETFRIERKVLWSDSKNTILKYSWLSRSSIVVDTCTRVTRKSGVGEVLANQRQPESGETILRENWYENKT